MEKSLPGKRAEAKSVYLMAIAYDAGSRDQTEDF